MFNIALQRTQTERTGDSVHPFHFNHTQEHQKRVEAHRKRVQEEYFDSGLYHKEMHEHYSNLPSNYRAFEESVRNILIEAVPELIDD